MSQTFPFYPFNYQISNVTQMFPKIFPQGCKSLQSQELPNEDDQIYIHQMDKDDVVNMGLCIKYGVLSMRKEIFAALTNLWKKSNGKRMWIMLMEHSVLTSICKVVDVNPSRSFRYWCPFKPEYWAGTISVEHIAIGNLQIFKKNLHEAIKNNDFQQLKKELKQTNFRLSLILGADQWEENIRSKQIKCSQQEKKAIQNYFQTGIKQLKECIEELSNKQRDVPHANQNRRRESYL